MMLSLDLRAEMGATDPNLHPSILIPSKESVWMFTTVPPSSGPSAGSTPRRERVWPYSNIRPLDVNSWPSSLTLTSITTAPSGCAGLSQMIMLDDTSTALTGSALPNPQSWPAPIRCSPWTRMMEDPPVGPRGGRTVDTVASTLYSNSTLLSLKPPSMTLTSTVVMPGWLLGVVHITSCHPMHSRSLFHFALSTGLGTASPTA